MTFGRTALLSLLALALSSGAQAQMRPEPWRYLMKDGQTGIFIRPAPPTEPGTVRFNILEARPASPKEAEWSLSTASIDCVGGRVRFEGGDYFYAAGHHYGWAPGGWEPISSKRGWWWAGAWAAICGAGYEAHNRAFTDQAEAIRAYRAGEIRPNPLRPPLDGRQIQVTAQRTWQKKDDFFGNYFTEIVLSGRKGDRIRLSWQSSVPVSDEYGEDSYEVDYPSGQTIMDLSRTITLTLNRDGEHRVVLSQIGVSFDPTPPGAAMASFNGRKVKPFAPFVLSARKLN
jgi:hypothetical protein